MQRPSPVCRRSDRDLALFLNRRLRHLLRETRRQQGVPTTMRLSRNVENVTRGKRELAGFGKTIVVRQGFAGPHV
jgi:hypothetical protein